MSDRAALASAVLDDWRDDAPRLAFADWLDEHGEDPGPVGRASSSGGAGPGTNAARAEFIRAQVEAERLPPKGRAKSAPAKRAAALLRAHSAAWFAALGLPAGAFAEVDRAEYARGFLEVCSVDPPGLVRLAPALAREPVFVRLVFGPGAGRAGAKALVANPALRAVTEIECATSGMTAARFVELFASPHLSNLSALTVFEDGIGAKGVAALAESPARFELARLDLYRALGREGSGESRDAVAAITVLASHPRFATLGELGLPANSLGDKSVELLLNSKTLPQGLKLGLADNDYDTATYDPRLRKRFKMVGFV